MADSSCAPGGQPDIAGPASANIIYIPLLCTGTDTDIETTPGNGTIGFQGDGSSCPTPTPTPTPSPTPTPTPCTTVCYVDADTGNDANGGASPGDAKLTIQAAVTQVSAGGTVIVAAGTYTENVTITKAMALQGAQVGVDARGRVALNQSSSQPVAARRHSWSPSTA